MAVIQVDHRMQTGTWPCTVAAASQNDCSRELVACIQIPNNTACR